MRLGLSSFAFAWAIGVPGFPPTVPMTAVRLIEVARESGLGLVQLADNLPLHDAPRVEIERIAAAAAAQSVSLELGTRGIGPHLERYAELAEELGSPFVRIVLDAADDRPTILEAARRLAVFEPMFRHRGLRLAVENHDRFPAADLAELVERLGDWVGICLDTVNSFGVLEPPTAVVDRLGPLALNLHLKDFTIRRHGHGFGFEIVGTPAGAGLLDIGWLLESLAVHGGVQTAALELWTPPEQDLDATIAKERRWVRASLDHLRTFSRLELA